MTPILISLVSLASRRFRRTVGGWLVAFPLISGPVVLFLKIENGAQFTAAAAAGCLSGALALVDFCVCLDLPLSRVGAQPARKYLRIWPRRRRGVSIRHSVSPALLSRAALGRGNLRVDAGVPNG
jgi:hypothetical protein